MGITSMKLLSLRLRNFKGLSEFAIEPVGANLIVCGDNATGKTTISDAYHWLIDGKDSSGSADFGIKTLSQDGSEIHNLNHEVEAEFESASGKRITLAKSYHEVWTKQRGSAEAAFTGHTTDYMVNGVPVTKGEYEAHVQSMCNPSTFRLLVNPEAFARLHWGDRRKKLMQICGDVSDDEVIGGNPSLSELPGILGDHDADAYRKIAKSSQSKINDELTLIPARIDEASRASKAVEPVVIGPLESALSQAREALTLAQSGGNIAELRKQVATWQAEQIERVNEMKGDCSSEYDEAAAKAQAAARALAGRQDDLDSLHRKYDQHICDLEAEKVRRKAALDQYEAINQQVFEFSTEKVCRSCGQALPQEHLDELRAMAEAAYNAQKATDLESIIARGTAIKGKIVDLEAKAESLNSQIANVHADVQYMSEQAEVLKKAAEAKRTAPPDPSTDKKWRLLQGYIESAQYDIRRAELGEKVRIAEAQEAVDSAAEALRAAMEINARAQASQAATKRVKELDAREKEIAAQYEEFSRHLFLIEEFVRAKVAALTERINSRFRMARFKLFDIQVNGALAECCEITYQGVPWSDLNSGARVNVGLDIINTLADSEGFAPPIFIDNAESVTSIIPTAGQQVRLVVSASDPELRIESAKELALA